jgi:hypothetical protein
LTGSLRSPTSEEGAPFASPKTARSCHAGFGTLFLYRAGEPTPVHFVFAPSSIALAMWPAIAVLPLTRATCSSFKQRNSPNGIPFAVARLNWLLGLLGLL